MKLLLKLSNYQTFDEKKNCEISSKSLHGNNGPDHQKIEKQKTSEKKYLPSPTRPKKRSYTNRVGKIVSIMRTHYKVCVDLPNPAKDNFQSCEQQKSKIASNKLKRSRRIF